MTYIQQFLHDIIGSVPVGYEYLEYIASFLVLVGICIIAGIIITFPVRFIKGLFKK